MKKFVAYYLLVSFIFSCSTSDDSAQDVYYEILPVESAIVPDQFHLGDTYEITLTYIRPSTCYAFNNIYFVQEANERTVAVVAYVVSGNNNCETLNEEMETSFNLKATQSGSYIFKFWQGGNNYMVVEVPVVD
ncbi:hypothetical protein [Xanthomarina sp. F2636L]|uniref:hypothetical protein n=1 Tax=Xanthomarina sp. F2636L TaxID=2996018 RepID=UPI00225E2D3D|nr:hypothetical protein [Xanthomarina sp. F2636L]MCX7551381.1 hypothetical protein [Xanthomarina sp. F2636L]